MKVKLKSKLGRPFHRFGQDIGVDDWTEVDVTTMDQLSQLKNDTKSSTEGGVLEMQPSLDEVEQQVRSEVQQHAAANPPPGAAVGSGQLLPGQQIIARPGQTIPGQPVAPPPAPADNTPRTDQRPIREDETTPDVSGGADTRRVGERGQEETRHTTDPDARQDKSDELTDAGRSRTPRGSTPPKGR